jgi:hypothetical protein
MITIGIDGNEANVDQRVGIGQFAYQIIKNFKLLSDQKEFNSLKFNIYLKDPPASDMPSCTDFWNYHIIGPKKLWTQFALPIRIGTRRENSVFFTPSHYAPRSSRPLIVYH